MRACGLIAPTLVCIALLLLNAGAASDADAQRTPLSSATTTAAVAAVATATTATTATTAAADTDASLVDANGLVFTSRAAFCRFHCKPTHAKRAYRHLRDGSECTPSRCGDEVDVPLAAAGAEQTDTDRSDDAGTDRAAWRRHLQATADVDSSASAARAPSYTFTSSGLRDDDDGSAGNAVAHAAGSDDNADADDKRVQTIDFVSCQGVAQSARSGATVALTVGDASTHAFAGFYEAFFEAYDAMIASANATYDACQLQFVQQGFLANATQSDKTAADAQTVRPMLVKLNQSHIAAARDRTELACVNAIKRVWRPVDETFTPFLTQSSTSSSSNATIMLVHVNASVADAIVDIDCVESVTSLPAILKLTPFAKSAYALAREDSVIEGPALEIRLVQGVDYAAAFTRLAAAIERVTGIANALTARGDGRASRVLTLAALEEFAAWTHAVAVIVDDDAVEWVDRKQTITTGALQPYATLEQRLLAGDGGDSTAPQLRGQPHRRLDTYLQDLVGVAPMQRHNITGTGIVVGVTDTGLYMDHDQFDQPSRAMYNTVDRHARKVVLYRAFANTGDESEQVVCGHGTHVSGILAGNSLSQKAPNLGIAYDAQIAFMDIGKQAAACVGQRGCEVTLETPGEVDDLMAMQVRAGAKIFSFSWGTGGNDYNTQSRDLDNYIYNHPETLIIVAAGNSGDKGAHTISSPSGAKNVLSIGASLNDAASFTLTPCPAVLNKQTVASFSSIGPTLDGRQKPDLVAPGMAIESAQSEAPGATVKSSAICSLQGTSQATPVVAGMAVLLYEWLRDGWWKHGVKDPQFGMKTIPAALLKALLIHSGEKLTRRLVAPKTGITSCVAMESQAIPLTSYPDFSQGYGKPTMLNLAAFASRGANSSSSSASGAGVYFYPNSSTGSEPRVVEGAEARFSFVLKQRTNLRVTLVWTDPAGSMGGRVALQNDLDLSVRVVGTDTVFYPLSGNGSRDARNNVEMVEVTYDDIVAAVTQAGAAAVAGDQSVTVEAVVFGYSVKAGAKTGQTFALVASSSPSSVATKALASTEHEFWQPWMTIGAIVAGTLATLVLIALTWRIRMARAAMSAKRAPRTGRAHPHYRGSAGGARRGHGRSGARPGDGIVRI